MYSCKEDPGNHDHADKKIDVNILVVPQSQWKTDLRHANLSTCTTSISAGFVRVCPDVTLVDLKDEVSQQLDSNFLPESYIFLRNVGHRLTLVGPKQESVLKVRLFLPPIAPCPEIYILNSSYLHSNQELLPPVKNVNGKKSSIENCNCNKNNYCAGHCSNPPYHHDHHLCSRTTPNLWWEERYRGTGCSFPVHNDAHSCCHNPTDYIATSEFSQPGKSTNKRFHSDTCTPASSSHDHSKPLKEGAFAKFRGTSKTYPQGNGSSQQVIDHPNGTHTSSNSRSSSDTNGLSNLGLKMHVTGSATQRSKTDNSGNLEQNDFTSTVLSQGMAIQNFHQSAPTLTNQEERCSDSKNAGPTVSKQNSKVGSSNTTKTNTTEAELSTTHNHSQSGNSHESENNQGGKQSEHCQVNSQSDPGISIERKMAEQRERKNTYPIITLNQKAEEPVGKQGIKHGQVNSPSDPAVSTERKMAEQREHKNTYPTITLNQKAEEQGGKQGIKHGQINSLSDPAFSTEKRMAEQRERKNTYPTITLNQTEAGEPVGKQGIKQGQINSPSDPAISTERKMAEQRERKNTYPTITLNQKAGEQVGKQGIKHGQFNSPSDPAITTERKMAEQRERKNTYPTITLNQKAEEQGGKKGIKHGQINSPSDPAVSTEKRMAEQSKDTYPTIALEHKQPEVATQQTINEPNKTNNSRQILSQEKNTNFKPKFDFKLANVPPLPPAITVTESNKIGKKDLLSLTKHKSPTGVTEQPKNKEPKVATHQTIDESNSTKNSRRIFSREKKSENTTIKPKFDTADLKLASVPPPLPAITVTERKKVGNNIDLLFLTKYKGATEAGSATAASESIVNKPRPSTAETNDILGEIRRMKEESEELLSLKAKLSSALRSIQIVVRTHREKHGNEWKIKYFQEKKMSTILEEKIHRTRNGNEKIKNGLDKIKAKKYTRAMQKLTHNPKVEPPSELSNVKIRCKRRKRDIERLRSKLESVKLQLSAERKIRESTVDECKTLRSELMKEKITHSRKKTKHQIAVAS